ncbi:MAG: polysaccharide deacetylase family protein [Chloroflexota bacterium]
MFKIRSLLKRAVPILLLILPLVSASAEPRLYAEGKSPKTSSSTLLRRVRVPILMYHYISVPPPDADKYRLDLSVTPDNFRRQMQWLKEHGYRTISPDDFMAAVERGKKLPDRPVLVTFDDGYIDAYTNAFPILRSVGFKGTFFIVTDWLDENKQGYLNWTQAKEMSQWGMSIENHSRRHEDMRKRDHDWLIYEILGPIESIEAHIGVRPLFFCYPAGQFDLNVVRELRAAGIEAAFTTNDGTYGYSDDMLRLPRVRIRGSTNLATFADLMSWER